MTGNSVIPPSVFDHLNRRKSFQAVHSCRLLINFQDDAAAAAALVVVPLPPKAEEIEIKTSFDL